jgi:hypothetical protein
MTRHRIGLGLGLLALLTLGCEDSTRLTYLPEPQVSRLVVTPERVKAMDEKYPGKDGVYLEQSVEFEIVTSPALETVRARNYTYVILNRNAERLSTFSVRVASGAELEKVYLQHRRPNGEQKEYGLANLKEERDSDGSRTYKFIYPNVEKGSVISEHYLIRHPSPRLGAVMDFEAPLQWELPCEQVRLRFLHPDSWEGQVKRLAANRTLPYARTLDPNAHKVIYTYEAKDVPGLGEEPFAPFFKEVSNYFQFTFQTMPSFQYRGSVNWQDFKRDFSRYAVDKEAIVSQRVLTTTTEIVKECKTDEERLDAVITWLQNNVTYGSLPNNPNFADMLASKHADIYQCTGLAKSMLSRVGISSTYVLMHSQRDGFFDESFISFDEISTPGLKVSLGAKTFVVFPWAKGLPITHLPEAFQGSVALMVGPDVPADVFTRLPEGNLAANTWEENYDVVLDADGRATVKEEKVLKGSSAYGVRQSLKDLNKEETEKLLKKLLTYSEGEVKFTSVGFEHRDEPKHPLVIKLAYTVDNLVALTPEEVVFNTGGLFAPASSLKTKVDPKERLSPIRIYYDEARTKKVTLTFPAAWKLDTAIKDQSVENAFGALAMTIKSDKGRLQVDQTLRFKKASAEAKRFEELLPLTGRRSQLAIPTLVFKIQG